jgi:small-conductance mechanosensitive channel
VNWLMNQHVLMALVGGVLFAYVCFGLNLWHDRASRILKDKPPPSKSLHMILFFFAITLLFSYLYLFFELGRSLPKQLLPISVVLFLVMWWGLQYFLSLQHKRKMRGAGERKVRRH